jgi:hypothetical protein
MAPQSFEWTCSICSLTWVLQATATAPEITRVHVAAAIGYPHCVNEAYGLMSAQCAVDALAGFGLPATQAWVTFDEAYAIAGEHTGLINPTGLYHFMAIRGRQGADLWVANSAMGYGGVGELLPRSQFNAYGPVQVIYV